MKSRRPWGPFAWRSGCALGGAFPESFSRKHGRPWRLRGAQEVAPGAGGGRTSRARARPPPPSLGGSQSAAGRLDGPIGQLACVFRHRGVRRRGASRKHPETLRQIGQYRGKHPGRRVFFCCFVGEARGGDGTCVACCPGLPGYGPTTGHREGGSGVPCHPHPAHPPHTPLACAT